MSSTPSKASSTASTSPQNSSSPSTSQTTSSPTPNTTATPRLPSRTPWNSPTVTSPTSTESAPYSPTLPSDSGSSDGPPVYVPIPINPPPSSPPPQGDRMMPASQLNQQIVAKYAGEPSQDQNLGPNSTTTSPTNSPPKKKTRLSASPELSELSYLPAEVPETPERVKSKAERERIDLEGMEKWMNEDEKDEGEDGKGGNEEPGKKKGIVMEGEEEDFEGRGDEVLPTQFPRRSPKGSPKGKGGDKEAESEGSESMDLS